MGVYRSTKCPHCGRTLENYTRATEEKIGPPVVSCNACKGLIDTGMKYWKEFTIGEKAWFWIEWFFGVMLSSFAYSIMGAVILAVLVWDNWLGNQCTTMLFISVFAIFFALFLLLYIKKQRKLMEINEGQINGYTSISSHTTIVNEENKKI